MLETLPPGTVLHERYRIERVLGSGGFGHVYLAQEPKTHQQFALKEYLVTGPSAQEQLNHEATVLRQLHHTNLPAFLDAFIERGRYYVVLNYIEGYDLTDLIRMARQRNDIVPLPRIMDWLLSICDAVMFLHSTQPLIIHRDIKPDNIRITSNGTAILVDLGNAKAAADGARTLFFIRHQGTPGYAPPEQYPGGSGTDTRSDVYALGGTLYFALTAHEPASVSTRNQALQQGKPDLPTLREVLANNPPEETPEMQTARQFRLGIKPARPAPRHSRHVAQLGTMPPELLDQLSRVIHRAMAMKPKDRYQYVADFANELRQIANAVPTVNQPATKQAPEHSTQPDLPQLYDALQAAKASAGQGMSTSPISDPSVPQSANTCPRCGASVVARAMFCPQCGTALAAQQKNTPPPTNSATNSVSGTHKGPAPDQTVLTTKDAVQSAISTLPRPSNPDNVPYTLTPQPKGDTPLGQAKVTFQSKTSSAVKAPPGQQAQSAQVQIQGTSTPDNTGKASQGQALAINTPEPDSSGFSIKPALMIPLIAVTIILLILMVFLLMTRS